MWNVLHLSPPPLSSGRAAAWWWAVSLHDTQTLQKVKNAFTFRWCLRLEVIFFPLWRKSRWLAAGCNQNWATILTTTLNMVSHWNKRFVAFCKHLASTSASFYHFTFPLLLLALKWFLIADVDSPFWILLVLTQTLWVLLQFHSVKIRIDIKILILSKQIN